MITLKEDITMIFDLTSGYSTRISWDASVNVKSVECFAENFHTVSKCNGDEKALVVVNLTPSTEYTVRMVTSNDEFMMGTFTTCPTDSPCLENLYKSTQRLDGVYDTTQFNKIVHDVFVESFNGVVSAGDSILAPVSLNGVKKDIMTSAVTEGGVVNVKDETSLFLPFSENKTNMQSVTLKAGDDESTLVYDAPTNSVAFGGSMYAVGESFEMFGKSVTVGFGSIILIFSDVVQKTWPFLAARALSVVGTAGSSFMKNMTANVTNVVAEKTTGASGTTYQSAWVHDTDLSTTEEVSRIVHTVDEDSEFATMSLGVLHTDGMANKFIEPAIQMTSTQVVISSQNDSDATRSALFDSEGLSFDTDDAAMYFGSNKNFRIVFEDGTPALLKIQSSDGVGGYVTRTEFTDST